MICFALFGSISAVTPAAAIGLGAPAAQHDKNVPVRPVTSHYRTPKQQPAWHAEPTAWPTGAATATVTGVDAVRAGTLPVWIGAVPGKPLGRLSNGQPEVAPKTAAPSRVRVAVASNTTSKALGVNGVTLSVQPADGATSNSEARVTVDYSTFADAFGGDWSDRLELVELPACALTTPGQQRCRTEKPLVATNDTDAASITTDLALPSTAVVALTSAASGGGGNFAATTLKPSGAWQAGGSADSFDYSYPIGLPPVPGGLAPDVTLTYDSQSVDGLTSSTNNQASDIGDGWEYSPGYIERSYQSCDNNPVGATKTGDNCWSDSDTLTLSLNGQTTSLVQDDATGTYHPQNDEHEQVRLVTGAVNGAQNGEHFVVTTDDGTTYYYGLDELPGWGPGDATTNSVWTEPVFATAAGQPCFSTTFADSWCQQAYRWNLDYVVDAHSDAVSYFYDTETNFYARDGGATADTTYVRGGHLAKIQYGQRDNLVYTTMPAAQVVFTETGRCDQATCDPGTLTKATASHWPDVPFDLNCASGAACTNSSPAFWSEFMLQSIQTQELVGTTETDVDEWAFQHTFPNPGDTTPTNTGTTPSLWLSSIVHSGQDTSAGGSTAAIALPAITFASIPLTNRVNQRDGVPPLTRQRMSQIKTETGELISVDYSSPACGAATPDESANTSLCYPSFWTPLGQTAPIEDWFNKYIVTHVTQDDPTGGTANDQIDTTYTPVGSPAWHFDDNPLTKSDERTWNDWRGFQGMIVSQGKAPDPVTKTQYTYFRGMDGDTLPAGTTRHATVTDSRGDPGVTDADQFEGETYETVVFNGSAVVTDTIDTPWSSAATGSRALSGLPALRSFLTGVDNTKVYTPLASGTTRETETDYTHDADGRVVKANDRGDVAINTDDMCTTTTFADNTSKWILDKPVEERSVSADCATTAPPNSAVVTDELTYYDGAVDHTTAPTIGDATETQELISFTGATPNYATTKDTYDEYGRQLSETDPDNRRSTTAYTPLTAAEPTRTVTTDPLGHATTTTQDPAHDLTLSTTDAAGFATSQQYDALGRLTQVSKPGLSDPALKYTYAVSDTGPSAVDTFTLNVDGTYRLSEALYDSMLRLRETQTQIPDGTPTNPTDNPRDISDTIYNSDGWVGEATDPYFNGDPVSTALVQAQAGDVPSQTHTTYDDDGRKTADISDALSLETWRTTYTYGGNFVTTVPPAGGTATTTFTDARGNTTDLYQYHAGVPADPRNDPAADYSDTHYTYTPAGKQATVVDAAGSTWSDTYDLLGDQTTTSDPDAGTTTDTYDAAGQLLTATDARGKQSTTRYDSDGRQTGTFDTTGNVAPTTANQTAAWTYDNSFIGSGPAKAVGYLSTTTSTSGGDTVKQNIRQYDNQAHSVSVTTTLTGTDAALAPAAGYTVGYGYTITGYSTGHSDPAAGNLPAENITVGYDQFGDPTTLSNGNNKLVSAVGYSELGQPVQYTMPATAGSVTLALSYDQQTRALTDVTANDTGQPTTVDDTAYRYGGNGVSKGTGLVTSVTDKQNAGAVVDTQCFTYDYADRLSQAWTATDACGSTPSPGSAGTVGGPSPYWQSWTYDAAGDRLSQVDHDTSGVAADDTTTGYHYPATDQPHTLTSTTAAGPDAATQAATYGYDAAGNTTSVVGGAAGNQTLTWNDQNQLATDTTSGGTASYVYDADGDLLVQRDPSQTTLYLDDEQLVLNKGTGAISGTRLYTIGDTTIAARTGTAPPVYLIPDRQGTDQLTIDSSTYAVTRRQFLPFGRSRGTVPTSWAAGAKGYVGGTFDATTGLENLGAREYDAGTGRFLSDDPEFEADDPTQLAGYDYAGNDPVTHSDPTGNRVDDSIPGLNALASARPGDTKTIKAAEASTRAWVAKAPERKAQQDWNTKHLPVVHNPPAPAPSCSGFWGCTWQHAKSFVRSAKIGISYDVSVVAREAKGFSHFVNEHANAIGLAGSILCLAVTAGICVAAEGGILLGEVATQLIDKGKIDVKGDLVNAAGIVAGGVGSMAVAALAARVARGGEGAAAEAEEFWKSLKSSPFVQTGGKHWAPGVLHYDGPRVAIAIGRNLGNDLFTNGWDYGMAAGGQG